MMLLPPWSDVLFVSFPVAILLFIVWMVFKRDRSADPEPLVPKDYEKLPLVNKIRVLTNKLIDVQRNGLGRNKTAVAEMRDRSAEIQRIRSVGELQYREVLLQCALVIEWLEESDEYRKRCAPPEIDEAYEPLTAADVKRASALASMPANQRPERPRPSGWAARDKPLSLPRVDRWVWDAAHRVTRDVDVVLDVAGELRTHLGAADAAGRALAALEFLRRVVVVTAEMDPDGDRTKIVLDFMVPGWMPLDRLPNAEATGPASRPLRGLCCIPVRYTKPATVAK